MISNLSKNFQQIISLGFICIFFIYGIASLKAETSIHKYNPKKPRMKAIPHIFQIKNNLLNSALNKFDECRVSTLIKPEKNLVTEKLSSTKTIEGGPAQPEMATFKPSEINNMVSKFSGDFSYNIPLLDIGGYPVNLFYNSGITMDQDASWVGLGWNINPGTINRNMRGLPDDFDGSELVTKQQYIRPDKTFGFSLGGGTKFIGHQISSILSSGISLDYGGGISWNNKLGFSSNFSLGSDLSLSALTGDDKTSSLKIGAGINLDSRTGAGVAPYISFSKEKKTDVKGKGSIGASYNYNSRMGITGMHLQAEYSKSKNVTYEGKNNEIKTTEISARMGILSSSLSFLYPTIMPSMKTIISRRNFSAKFSIGTESSFINAFGKIMGYYNESYISEQNQMTFHKAYGFLNFQLSNDDNDALLDFNRINDGVYTPSSPALAIPVYTYDIFNISGEGTGGTFRAYRNDIGYVRDEYTKSEDFSGGIGLDIGLPFFVHGGADISGVLSPTQSGAWKALNFAEPNLQFKSNDGLHTAAYFKNPAEKTIPDEEFQAKLGHENIVRFILQPVGGVDAALKPVMIKYDKGLNRVGELDISSINAGKKSRDKRTQSITFLNAEEATRIGFNRKIYSYSPDTNKILISGGCFKNGIDSINRSNTLNVGEDQSNIDSYRKPNHISQIEVTERDGRRYIYGIPVYNITQTDVSFSVNSTDGNVETGRSTYQSGIDDSINLNKKGRDWTVNKETMPGYAHSFLLTELISPNYVDVTGDGISDDDLGDAVKFNYTRFKEDFNWRTPMGKNQAAYNEGLKTDSKDDRAHYIYGEREKWLLYSIESKNMIARFFVKNDRKDSRQALNINGGLDASSGMLRLYKICLYSKGNLTNETNLSSVKPIKTIHLFQSYKLCKGAEGSLENHGKLTLDSIHITYNGNDRKPKQRYVFSYPSNNNPDYSYLGNDRWGNYKPSHENPGGLSNADYPYATQNKINADKYSAAWTMNEIKLPSGGKISLEYESDDYAFVQNKRAATFTSILGFGKTSTPDLSSPEINQIYRTPTFQELSSGADIDNDFVYVELQQPITGSDSDEKMNQLKSLYFADVSQLYIKLSVIMPSGRNIPGLSGFEIIPIYADIDAYGLVSSNVAWIKVKRLSNGLTPMVQGAFQFLRQQLPGKAFKTYDMSEDAGVGAVVRALAGMVSSIGELFKNVETTFRNTNKCRYVELSTSFVKLSNPSFKKYGGGLRVKKLTISDNWNKMTGQYESTYGQEYKYTTTEQIGSELKTISSGVASWEPAVGGDENPYNDVMRYSDHNKGGPYEFGAISLPIGEAFYPIPFVGYSKVEILSIHRTNTKNPPINHVSEFYTTRDFPSQSYCTLLSEHDAKFNYQASNIMRLLNFDLRKNITLSQGFIVHLNDMDGKIKREATYSISDAKNPISYTEYFYNVKSTGNLYEFNHSLPTIKTPEGKVQNSIIGRDIELMVDFRQHLSETFSSNLDINFDASTFGMLPITFANVLTPIVYEANMYRSAAVLKIVNHYGVLDSIVVVDRGSMVSTKNIVYDAETGEPLLSRTNNEFNRPLYNFSYPAHWAYSGMGPAYKNIDAEYYHLNFSHGKLKNMPSELENILESGDELYVVAKNSFSTIDFVAPCDANAGTDPWTTLKKSEENKIWALNTSKVQSITPQWVFMDKDGNPYNAKDATIRIVRSGHRNILNQNVATVTSLNSPVNNTTGELKFDDATGIINVSAGTFKDHWRVDQAFYDVDSTVVQTRYAMVHNEVFYAKKSYSLSITKESDQTQQHVLHISDDRDYISARQYYHSKKGGSEFDLKSWLLFDLESQTSSIKAESVVLRARLSLYSHSNNNYPVNHFDEFPIRLFYGHHNSNPHEVNHLDHRTNDFKINRMMGRWLPNGDSYWLDYFRNHENDNVTDQLNPQPPLTSALNYSLTETFDNTIESTKFFREMLRAKYDPSINFSPAIKIRIPYYARKSHLCQASVCFFAKTPSNTGDNKRGFMDTITPHFSVKFYNCSEAYPFGYVPQEGEEVAKCSDTTFHAVFCYSKFLQKKSINPYTEGIFGNWRSDSSFVFYGSRKENDPDIQTDLRTAGTITGFKNFWNFATSPQNYLLRNYGANNVWVWTGTVTQFNRKGYEIENKDPLGRYNSGLYGYNQHLPIAVANNARLNEILFDGFEDYDYTVSKNCIDCKPRKYFNFDKDVALKISSEESHTGNKSLKLDAGSDISVVVPVLPEVDFDNGYALRIKIDSTYSQVGNTGLGLKAEFFNNLILSGTPVHTIENAPVNFDDNYLNNIPGLNSENRSIRWTGKIKMNTSGNFAFRVSTSNNVKIYINNILVLSTDWSIIASPAFATGTNFSFQAGQLYDIRIEYQNWFGPSGNVILFGKRIAFTFASSGILSNSFLYSPTNIYTTTNALCNRLDSVNVRENALTDTFALIKGKQMLISAWVKEGSKDCKCENYIGNSIRITVPETNSEIALLRPSGNIIEGWQRYEGAFIVPSDAEKLKISFTNSLNNSAVYFDDIRIQPFNSNMKTFVYGSSNLRLLAELDENNFASFYEYDNDGTLNRLKKETERGIKTISETRSALLNE